MMTYEDAVQKAKKEYADNPDADAHSIACKYAENCITCFSEFSDTSESIFCEITGILD